MNPTNVARILAINRQFYQTFALQFSATRQRLQPGVQRMLETIDPHWRILDIGCGNGQLARILSKRGQRSHYIGLDMSEALLAEAEAGAPTSLSCTFLLADLALPDWDSALPIEYFDLIIAFGVLHHLPSADLRRQVLLALRAHLSKGGLFIHSEWQFLHSPRLLSRLQAWESIGLNAEDVEPGDYLLDWRRGGSGLRYVHLFDEEELASLAEATGFKVIETFQSDGEGGKLGLYQVWKLV